MRIRFFHRIGVVVVPLLLGPLAALEAGTLSGSFSSIAAGSNVNLTAIGKLDWVHWGLYTDTSIDRKGSVSPQIGHLQVVGQFGAFLTAYQYANHYNGYTWLDGYPEMTITNTTTGVWAYGFPNLGSGFRFAVPADNTTRTVQVFVGVYKGRGTLTATLSDGSAPGYTNNSLANTTGLGPGGVYTLTYAADAPEQTLRIEWRLTQLGIGNPVDANVTLQAAALTAPDANNPPFVSVTSPMPDAAFPAPANVQIEAAAEDFDGSVVDVKFYEGTNLLGQLGSPPYQFIWNTTNRGRYSLTATATDDSGATTTSRPVEVFVHGNDGSQSVAVVTSPAAVDLTLEGTSDWAHWGLITNTSFDYKAVVPRQISNFTQLGTNLVTRYTDNPVSFSWTDGVLTQQTNGTITGLYITGVDDGFYLTVPADAEPRQLRVYVGGYGTHADFQAYLSDFSAPPYTDSSVSNVYGNVHFAYTIDYKAASPGQQLIITHRNRIPFDYTYGNVTLEAATLVGGNVLLPVKIFDPVHTATDFRFSFVTQSDRSYGVQATGPLSPQNWTNVATLPGTGGTVTFTNYDVPSAPLYYRVLTQ